jgi:two-component system sensor histidine kinase/response regulator
MVKMILRNLISNAIKFSFKDSSINISAETDEHFVIIHVADTGIGMREEDLAQLFSGKNYSRMGTSNEKGSGLGLTLCKEFLQKNNGTMWVDSEENKGSTFSFKIPISDKNLA